MQLKIWLHEDQASIMLESPDHAEQAKAFLPALVQLGATDIRICLELVQQLEHKRMM